jgi:hypothetical protein
VKLLVYRDMRTKGGYFDLDFTWPVSDDGYAWQPMRDGGDALVPEPATPAHIEGGHFETLSAKELAKIVAGRPWYQLPVAPDGIAPASNTSPSRHSAATKIAKPKSSTFVICKRCRNAMDRHDLAKHVNSKLCRDYGDASVRKIFLPAAAPLRNNVEEYSPPRLDLFLRFSDLDRDKLKIGEFARLYGLLGIEQKPTVRPAAVYSRKIAVGVAATMGRKVPGDSLVEESGEPFESWCVEIRQMAEAVVLYERRRMRNLQLVINRKIAGMVDVEFRLSNNQRPNFPVRLKPMTLLSFMWSAFAILSISKRWTVRRCKNESCGTRIAAFNTGARPSRLTCSDSCRVAACRARKATKLTTRERHRAHGMRERSRLPS